MNTTKTYGASGNKFGHTDQDGIERFWRHLLAGAASIRFHRPDSGLGLSDKSVACLRTARRVEALAPLWTLQPANNLLSRRDPNEAYLAANPGEAYVLYFPRGGEIELDVSAAQKPLAAHWFNIDSGKPGRRQQLPQGRQVAVKSPGKANWAAAIVPASPP